MIIYQVFGQKNKDGKWFETFEVPDNLPLPDGYTTVSPPDNLRYPRWEYGTGWVEDKDQLIAALSADVAALQSSDTSNQNAVMDLMEMVSQLGGDASV